MIADIMIAHIPTIGWMSLANIDEYKLDLVVKLPIEVSKAHGPGYERRSGKAAKNQGNGSLTEKL